MQPARLGVSVWCIGSALLGTMVLAPPSSAQQAVLQTPQEVNDRIRSLSASARLRPHDYVIGSGDVLVIDVFDVHELSREVRVSQTGSIGLPLVPVRLHVSGLTEVQAEQKIAEVLEANGLVSHPEVSVTVKERKSKPITVVGAVPHPMVYQADREVTLLEVLAEAGGVSGDAGDTVIVTRPVRDLSSEDASEPPAISSEQSAASNASKSSTLQRPSDTASSASQEPGPSGAPPPANSTPGAPVSSEPPSLNNTITVNLNELMETGDTANNILLQAGDIVTVPHSGVVYVLGAVGRPGGFVLSNDRGHMTILKILALAGGASRTAKSDHAVIIRKDQQGQQHEVAVNLKKVVAREAEDLQLLPSDVLYVPESAGKHAMLRAAELGIALGTAVALYRVAYQ